MRIAPDIAILAATAATLAAVNARGVFWVAFGGLVAVRMWVHRPAALR